MDDEKYEEFFKEVKEFLAEQKLQRLRGLNEYNLLQAVRDPNEEVGLHSRFLYSFLDTNGVHYQDDLFVNIFVKTVLKIDDFGKVVRFEKEVLTDTNRRIDFVIESEKYLIGIEMKIDASDQEHQIYDYYTYLKKIESNEQNVIIYYLTKDGREASNTSYKRDDFEVKYKQISFKEDILKWIDESQKQVENITNLSYALEEYKEIVEIITEPREEKGMQMKDLILKNMENYEYSAKIHEAYEKAKKENIEQFIKRLKDRLKNNSIACMNTNDADKIWIKLSEKNEFFYGLQIKFDEKDKKEALKISIFKKNESQDGWQTFEIEFDEDFVKKDKHYEYNRKFNISPIKLLKDIDLEDLVSIIMEIKNNLPKELN